MKTSSHSVSHGLAASRIDQYLLERAPRSSPLEPQPAGKILPVITISRSLGIPAREIACRIARELGFHVFDKELLDTVARDSRLSEQIVATLEEGKRSTLYSWIQSLVQFDHPVLDPKSFVHMLVRVIRGISLHGSAVILGRGANFILKDTGAFRVRLTAPVELRVQALMSGAWENEPMSAALARAEIEKHARERRDVMKKYFRADIDDPQAYDAIFNLRRLDPEHAACLIIEAYRRTIGTAESP